MSSDTTRFNGQLTDLLHEKGFSSFDELYLHYAPQLKRYILKRVPNVAAAEELVHDTLLKVLLYLRTISSRNKL
jgi:DNA-directed RNA polymerase specialized sigma24 family protein